MEKSCYKKTRKMLKPKLKIKINGAQMIVVELIRQTILRYLFICATTSSYLYVNVKMLLDDDKLTPQLGAYHNITIMFLFLLGICIHV